MATKHFCDATAAEITGKVCEIRFLRHITRKDSMFPAHIDREGNPLSNVEDSFIVSQASYNEIMGAAWDKFQEIKKRSVV